MAFDDFQKYGASRASLRERFGSRRIRGAAPNVSNRANPMLASNDLWVRTFKDTGVTPTGAMPNTTPGATPTTEMPYRVTGDPSAGIPGMTAPTQTPTAQAPQSAPTGDLASMFESFPAGAGSRVAATYLDATGRAIGLGGISGGARSGDNLTSRYGTGSVLSGQDYASSMRAKLRGSGFSDTLYG